jgi:hypothetical protein
MYSGWIPNSPTPSTPPQINESRKKKVVFPDFTTGTSVTGQVPHAPSQYAVGKIESLEYVDLWYFTTEGCKEASKTTPTAADETFGILNTDTGLTLQPIKATKASRNAITDEHLTWEQIMTARHTLITTTNRVGWPTKHTLSLAEFYINLEGLRAAGNNPRALILYHAVVRRLWHEAMEGRGNTFDLSVINEDLFHKLENQIRDHDQEELLRKASNFHKNLCNETILTEERTPPLIPPTRYTYTQRDATPRYKRPRETPSIHPHATPEWPIATLHRRLHPHR